MILIVGATGDLGGRVARKLSAEGQDVRCLVRSESDGAELRELGAQVVHGDLTQPASLKAACQDADTVIATATAITRRLTGKSRSTVRAVDEQGMLSLVEAAETAGVRRFVYVSFAGIESGVGTPLEHAKLTVEKRLAASAMRRVIARPDALQEVQFAPLARFDIAAGKASVIGKGDTKRRWVATDDVAALLSAVALEADPPTLIEFGGPQALTRNEAIGIAAELAHRQITTQRMPRPVARLVVRLLDRRNDALASALGAGLHQDLKESDWDDGPLLQRGISPRPASDFLREEAQRLTVSHAYVPPAGS